MREKRRDEGKDHQSQRESGKWGHSERWHTNHFVLSWYHGQSVLYLIVYSSSLISVPVKTAAVQSFPWCTALHDNEILLYGDLEWLNNSFVLLHGLAARQRMSECFSLPVRHHPHPNVQLTFSTVILQRLMPFDCVCFSFFKRETSCSLRHERLCVHTGRQNRGWNYSVC